MPDRADRFRLAVRRFGPLAGRLLEAAGEGRVVAVFRRSFYVGVDGRLACLGNRDLAMGPLGLRTEAAADTDWSASGVREADRVRVGPTSVRVGALLAFPFDAAAAWAPPPPPAWSDATLRRGVRALVRAAPTQVPDQGLAAAVFCGRASDRVGAAAAGPLQALRRWIESVVGGAAAPVPAPVARLIGLGPGLTPSGDDVLAGAMIGLNLLRETRAAAALYAAIVPHLATHTGPIAAAHLAAAAEGLGGEALHALLADVFAGRPHLDHRLMAIDAIGHTSGWDTLAGAACALQAWLAVRPAARRASVTGVAAPSLGVGSLGGRV